MEHKETRKPKTIFCTHFTKTISTLIKLTSRFTHFSELPEKLTSNSEQSSFPATSLRNLGRLYRSRFQLSCGKL